MRALVREAMLSARSQPVASTLTLLVIFGMVLTVMLTAGRTVATEQEILASFDDAGSRAIQVRADDSAGVRSDVIDRLRHIDGIEWAAAFSSPVDATNAMVPGGTSVPVRYVYSDHLERLGAARSWSPGTLAYASQAALDAFGLPDVAGSISLTNGADATIAGRLSVPDFLESLEPLVLIPAEADPTASVNFVLVVAERPDLVGPVSRASISVLGADDPAKVRVETSEALAQLRGIVQSQLGASSRALVLGLLATSAALVAMILYGLVMMRRKDFGRRRALGATRSYIVTLLVTQTAILACTGATAGTLAATGAAVAMGNPLPGVAFTLALGMLAVVAAVTAALVPAIVASRREPIRELRIP